MGHTRAAVALVLAGFAGLVSGQGAPHGPDGYRNNYPHGGRESFWAWQWERMRDGLPKAPSEGWNLPAVKTDPATLRSPETNPSVTWIGHATMFVRLAGKNILFDPIFAGRASPFAFAGPKRIVPLPIDIAELPPIDVVLISHNHYDHLDADAVARLAAMPQGSPRFLVPLGLKAWFATLGITRVDEYDWWQETREGDLAITFVPVQHWSKRRLDDANQTLWGGWVVAGEGLRLVHTGDTGLFERFPRHRRTPRAFRHGVHPDRCLRAALVHEGDARGCSRGRADPRRLEGGTRDRHALGHLRDRRRAA